HANIAGELRHIDGVADVAAAVGLQDAAPERYVLHAVDEHRVDAQRIVAGATVAAGAHAGRPDLRQQQRIDIIARYAQRYLLVEIPERIGRLIVLDLQDAFIHGGDRHKSIRRGLHIDRLP